VLGPDHPDTIACRDAQALERLAAGQAGLALKLAKRNVAAAQRAFPSRHPEEIACRSSLGLAYRATGRAADAITAHKRTCADYERILGAGHLLTSCERVTLGTTCLLAEEYQAGAEAPDRDAITGLPARGTGQGGHGRDWAA
jgi:tetratricopeptide repeat protein